MCICINSSADLSTRSEMPITLPLKVDIRDDLEYLYSLGVSTWSCERILSPHRRQTISTPAILVSRP